MSIDFLDNVPVTVEFSFDEPVHRTTKNGDPYFSYGVKLGGEDEYLNVWSNINELHLLLQLCKVQKGTVAKITHKQNPADKKRKFWEVEVDGVTRTSSDLGSAKMMNEAQAKTDEIVSPTKPTEQKVHDRFWREYKRNKKRWEEHGEVIDLSLIAQITMHNCNRMDKLGVPYPDSKEEGLPF